MLPITLPNKPAEFSSSVTFTVKLLIVLLPPSKVPMNVLVVPIGVQATFFISTSEVNFTV